MTATAERRLPPITCPSSLIASCPPLLGFHPERSLICVGHSAGSARPVIARVDIVGDDLAPSCAADLAQRLARTGARQVTVVLWLDAPDDTLREELHGLVLVEHLQSALLAWGLPVDLAVATNGQAWWPLLCPDHTCCSGLSRPVDVAVSGRIRVEYAVAGYAPLPARSALAERLTADPERVARVGRHLAEASCGPTSLAERRRLVDQLWRVLRPLADARASRRGCHPDRHLTGDLRLAPRWPPRVPATSQQATVTPATVVAALDDVGIRDALLVRMADDDLACRACWQHSIEVLADVVRAAPLGHVAPAATLLGLAAWLSGDGAMATLAAERALADDPEYRLASLSLQLFGSGLDPRDWRASATGLTEEECLRKAGRPSPGSR